MPDKQKYILGQQKKIVGLVTNKFRDFYLTGGTALTFYYNHRFSEDLDFFTQQYSSKTADKIIGFISGELGFAYTLEQEQNRPRLVKMKVYSLDLGKGCNLKVDIVQDYVENIKKINNGLHSVDDIYFRKIYAAIGADFRESITGQIIPTGRQSAKDLFDLYYLSNNYKAVSDFFLEYFTYDKAESFFVWYRNFNRTNLKIELMDLVENVDTSEVLNHLDSEILKKLADKLL